MLNNKKIVTVKSYKWKENEKARVDSQNERKMNFNWLSSLITVHRININSKENPIVTLYKWKGKEIALVYLQNERNKT
jgi:hypothetical protein